MYVLRETWNLPSRDHATEQSQSSGHATEQAQSQRDNIIEEDCEDIVYDDFLEWSGRLDNQTFYDEPALLLHKQMWDIMSRN